MACMRSTLTIPLFLLATLSAAAPQWSGPTFDW